MLIIPLNLGSVLLWLHNSKLAYLEDCPSSYASRETEDQNATLLKKNIYLSLAYKIAAERVIRPGLDK